MQPRKKRESLSSKLTSSAQAAVLIGPSRAGLVGQAIYQSRNASSTDLVDKHGLQGQKNTHEFTQGFGTWHRSDDTYDESDPSLAHKTIGFEPPSSQIQASVDEQLHDWDAYWISAPTADPFRNDWSPKPFEKFE